MYNEPEATSTGFIVHHNYQSLSFGRSCTFALLFYTLPKMFLFIGPESDHWQCLSVTHSLTDSLTHSCLVNLIDVTLACEDANSKLVEIVTVAVDAEDHVGNGLLQILKLRFGHKA